METTTESNGMEKKCGRRYGQDQREAILGRYRESGMELSAYARQADVSGTTLKRWMGAGGKGPRLVAVRMKEPEGRSAMVEARFVCGATIRAPAVLLPELVRSLRRPCRALGGRDLSGMGSSRLICARGWTGCSGSSGKASEAIRSMEAYSFLPMPAAIGSD